LPVSGKERGKKGLVRTECAGVKQLQRGKAGEMKGTLGGGGMEGSPINMWHEETRRGICGESLNESS